MNKNFIKKVLSSTTFANKSGAGFTLIETIIYLALFSIIIGGGMVAAYQIIQNTDSMYNHVTLQEEANFLFRKIDWTLTGATAVSTPSFALVISKPISGVLTQLTFILTGSNLTLQRDLALAVVLNSSSVVVSAMSFLKITGLNGKPDSIVSNFTLTTSQNDRPASQSFSFTKYLRQ